MLLVGDSMVKERINDIEIIYNEDNHETEEFKMILKNNYALIKKKIGDIKTISFVECDDENILYLEKPLDFVNNIIKEFLDNNIIISSFENTSLEEMYINFLTRKLNVKEDKRIIEINPYISNEFFYQLFYYFIGYHYFKENNNMKSYLDYVKYHKSYNEAINWFVNKVRFSTSNILLEELINYFDDTFINNIDEITTLLNNELTEDNISNMVANRNKLEPITRRELEYLFIKYLDYIKAPGSWYKLYYNLKTNKNILYTKTNRDIDESQCFVDNGELKILIDSDDSIRDLISLVHEFMHYVSRVDKSTIGNYAVLEFPSIFFERLCAEFLIDNGYGEEIVSDILRTRKGCNLLLCMKIGGIYNIINKYIKNGPINEKDEIERVARRIHLLMQDENAKRSFINMYEKANLTYDTKDIVYRNYDNLIRSIIENGPSVVLGYQYIIGTLLTEKIFENVDDEIIRKMITITNELKNINLQDIENIFDVSVIKENIKK